MLMYSGILFLVISLVLTLFVEGYRGFKKKEISSLQHRLICMTVIAAGCMIRCIALNTLLSDINAEEALSAVQAKALWQTGGFLFDGELATQFQQWIGETGGPLLSCLAAPFVGIMGMTPLAVRTPLTLLSCVAMLAAYGAGKELAGKNAGRWMLTVYSLCPAFILNARFAAAANCAVFLMPIALYMLLRGFRSTACLYIGMLLTSFLAYTYDLYFYVVPLIIIGTIIAVRSAGVKRYHVFAAGLLGFIVYLPAFLTLCVNLFGYDSFTLFDAIRIPRLEGFAKTEFVWKNRNGIVSLIEAIRDQAFAVILGSVFQVLRHENISNAMFAPDGILTFYMMSVPLIMLGALHILCACIDQKKEGNVLEVKRVYLIALGIVVFLVLLIVGNRGINDLSGGTSIYDYSALFFFIALAMTAGLCRIEKRSSLGGWGMLSLFAASCIVFCVFLFGGTYQNEANTHFRRLKEAYQIASELQEETENKVCLTTSVYPHIDPPSAAEIMYLYASDADMASVQKMRERVYQVLYLEGIEYLDPEVIYVAKASDLYQCELSNHDYEEYGEYVLLSPLH